MSYRNQNRSDDNYEREDDNNYKMSREEAGRKGGRATARNRAYEDNERNYSRGRQKSNQYEEDDDDTATYSRTGHSRYELDQEDYSPYYRQNSTCGGRSRNGYSSEDEDNRRGGSRSRSNRYEDDLEDQGRQSYSRSNYDEDEGSDNRGRYSQGRSRSSRYYEEESDDHYPMSRSEAGSRGAAALHSKSSAEQRRIAHKAAETRKKNDPDAFRKMGEKGGRARRNERDRDND